MFPKKEITSQPRVSLNSDSCPRDPEREHLCIFKAVRWQNLVAEKQAKSLVRITIIWGSVCQFIRLFLENMWHEHILSYPLNVFPCNIIYAIIINTNKNHAWTLGLIYVWFEYKPSRDMVPNYTILLASYFTSNLIERSKNITAMDPRRNSQFLVCVCFVCVCVTTSTVWGTCWPRHSTNV